MSIPLGKCLEDSQVLFVIDWELKCQKRVLFLLCLVISAYAVMIFTKFALCMPTVGHHPKTQSLSMCPADFWMRYVRYLAKQDPSNAPMAIQRAQQVHCKREASIHLFAAKYQELAGTSTTFLECHAFCYSIRAYVFEDICGHITNIINSS